MTPPALPVLLTWPFHPSSDPHSASPVCVCAMQCFGQGHWASPSCWAAVTSISFTNPPANADNPLLLQFQGGASSGMGENHGDNLPSVVPLPEAHGKCWWDFLLLECEEFTSGWYRHKQAITQLGHCTVCVQSVFTWYTLCMWLVFAMSHL